MLWIKFRKLLLVVETVILVVSCNVFRSNLHQVYFHKDLRLVYTSTRNGTVDQ